MILVDQIRDWLEKDKSVKRVAEDLELTSELILLVRMIFADGEMRAQELSAFKRICKIAFEIPEDDVPKVLRYLKEYGYETSVTDATAMFKNLDAERKKSLLLHMLSIAKADSEVHHGEIELIRSTAELLGMTPEELTQMQNT
ncbi:MAG: TerB family tellurite resistance protein [Pseudomonadota bacterium]